MADTKTTKKTFQKVVADFMKSVSGEKLENKYLNGMVTILKSLTDNPDNIILMVADLEVDASKEPSKPDTAKEKDIDWEAIETAGQISKWYVWAWINSKLQGTEHELTSEAMELIDRKSGQGTSKNIAEIVTGIGPRTKIPPKMRSKPVIFEIYDRRYVMMCRSLVVFSEKYVDLATGIIDWPAANPYVVVNADGGAQIVKHIQTQVEVSVRRGITIDSAWKPVNPWSDVSMKWVLDRTPYVPAQHITFEPGSVFHNVVVRNNDHIEEMVNEFLDVKEKAAKAASGSNLAITDTVAEAQSRRKKRRLTGAPAPEMAGAPEHPSGGVTSPAASSAALSPPETPGVQIADVTGTS
ncbi:unnamed protein product [Prorocentrum cordatum]|uniref:Uncharacterized protein n=1 Tax=Prorocentrum cordatum TaxID=2364126 RepID=A0ABN9SDQ6_9DINO|nr:unnamed protein product [Polarella glacialis]